MGPADEDTSESSPNNAPPSTASESDSSDVVDISESERISLYQSEEDSEYDSMSAIFGQSRLFSRNGSPMHWATLSDTIAVSPAALPILKVVGFCSSTVIETITAHDGPDDHPTAHRCRSVPNLDEEKLKHSDEEVRKMRNALLSLSKSRAVFRQLRRDQKWALAAICLVYFSSFCAISVLSPFFHGVAVKHGISTSTYGLIFSVHPLVVFCTSPFIGQIIPSIGPKFMFVSGVFLCGACNLLFGTLEFIEDDTQFLILCFAVRGLAALGASAFSTAGATFVANMFPDKISAVMGILETFIGLGFSIGPVIGGALYTLGGFQLPFYVLGTVMSLTLPLNLWVLPATDEEDIHEKSGARMLSLFKSPAVVLICLVVTVSSSAWSVLEPTLVIHMQQFDTSALYLGLLFLLTSASYALSSPFWGWLADKYDHGNLMMIAGLSVTALSLLLLGPSPLLPAIPNLLWLNIVSLIMLGIFDALAYLPTYHALLHHATDLGWQKDLGTYSVIAGLWASVYSLGEVIGPSVGTALVDLYDFPTSMTVIGLMNLLVAILLLLYQVINVLLKRKRSPNAAVHIVQKVEAVITAGTGLGGPSGERRPLLCIGEEVSTYQTLSS